MIEHTNNFGLSEKQINEAQDKYVLLESLLGSYLSMSELKKYREQVCQTLGISKRTLRRYIQKYQEKGLKALARKTRSDSGKYRVFSEEILVKAKYLLDQNPGRSVGMLLKLMEQDETLKDKVANISASTLYYYLNKAGYNAKNRERAILNKDSYRSFEADYANQMWQSDARHGIPLPNPCDPSKTRMTYCFVWLDDFSRKILFARYYWDEKLPSLDDSFRNAVLCYAIPEKIYLDNGSVYISNNFSFVVDAIGTRKIHHPPYSAWCKGKVEFIQKILKRIQGEFRLAGIKTLEELNATLNAWIEVEYNNKIHSSTGETPNARYRKSIEKHSPKRIRDLAWFNSLFLSRESRVINKYKQIKFKTNIYKIQSLPIGETIELRYDPFNLSEIQVFFKDKYYCNLKAYKLNSKEVQNIPEERKNDNNISKESQLYFSKIREKYLEQLKKQQSEISFSKLKNEDK